jgi:hypothetical protein
MSFASNQLAVNSRQKNKVVCLDQLDPIGDIESIDYQVAATVLAVNWKLSTGH